MIEKLDGCLKQRDSETTPVEAMHDGVGKAHSCALFHGHMKLPVFIHNTILDPGATIGDHEHSTSEEIYWFIEGEGVMSVNGREFPASKGDVILTQRGSRHALRNTGAVPLRIIVIGGEV